MRRWGALVVIAVIAIACASSGRSRRDPPPPLRDAVMLATFDPEAQVEGAPPAGAEQSPLEVLAVTPNGLSRGEPIRLRFNRVVAQPRALPKATLVVERQILDGSWARVDGRTSWSRPDRLTFEPTAPLPDAHRFRVRLDGDVGGVRGVRWEFETWRPSLKLVETWDELGPREPVQVWVDQRANAPALQSRLSVTDASGRRVKVRVRPSTDEDLEWDAPTPHATLLEVQPEHAWPRGTTLTLAVDADFRSEGAALPMGRRWSARVPTRDAFRVLGVDCPDARCPLGPVVIRTSTFSDGEGIRVVPEPPDLSIYPYDEDEDGDVRGIVLDGEFDPRLRYEVVLPRALEDEYGQRIRGRRRVPLRFTEMVASGAAELRLSDTQGIYASAEQARVGVLAHRVDEIEIRIAVLDPIATVPWLRPDALEKRAWPKRGRQTTLTRTLGPSTSNRSVRSPLLLGEHAKPGDTVLVEVVPKKLAPRTTGPPLARVRGLYRISGLGVFAHSGAARGIVRVTELASGEPRADVEVALHTGRERRRLGTTDAHGLLGLPGSIEIPADASLVARSGDDAVVVPLDAYQWSEHRGWVLHRRPVSALRYLREPIADEAPPKPLRRGERALVAVAIGRGVYMPGDLVELAGWASISTPYGRHNTRRIPAGTKVAVALKLGEREVVAAVTRVSEHGRFAKALRVPANATLGRYHVEATVLASTHAAYFEVAEPRIPAFELAAMPRTSAVQRGEAIEVDITARYLSGEPAPLHRLGWTIDCGVGVPDLDLPLEFTAWSDAEDLGWSTRAEVEPRKRSRLTFEIATEALDHRSGRSCSIAASGQDASHQLVGADTRAFVHPGPGYLAVAVPWDHDEGPRPIRVIAVDVGGQRIAAESVTIAIDRSADERFERVRTCKTRVAAEGPPASCRTRRLGPGEYRVRVTGTVADHPLEIEQRFWIVAPEPEPVSLPEPPPPPPPELVVNAPDVVEAGKAATITIAAAWGRGRGVLIVEQTGVRATKPFALEGGKARVEVVPHHGAGPRLEVTALVARPAERDERPRVARAEDFSEVIDRHHLEVAIDAPARAQPGERTSLRIRVRDRERAPVDARVTVWVVDDGLHQLRAPQRPSLEWIFNPDRMGERTITDAHRDLLEPFDPSSWTRRSLRAPEVRQAKGAVKGALDIEVRRRFDPAPLFVGDVGTGRDGEVEIPLALPDDITRFRVTAVASAELRAGATTGPARFGWKDAEIVVSTPLPIRAALPRVLRPGDRSEVAALVTIPATGMLAVDAAVTSRRGALRLQGARTTTLPVTEGEVVRVPFSVRAVGHGRARVRFTATLRPHRGRPLAGGVEHVLAVEHERTAVERAAIYGSVADDRAIAVPVRLPKASHGRLDVAVTTTALGELDDAAEYLLRYPYGCAEQSASRLVPLVALRGLASRLPDGGPDPEVVAAETIARLEAMQHDDGTFGYWPGDPEPAHLPSAYATWVLLLAKRAGIAVPKSMLQRAIAAVRSRATEELPDEGQDSILVERAFGVRALAETGDVPERALAELWEQRHRLPMFARLLLLQALHRLDPNDARVEPLLTDLFAVIEERPGVAHVVDPSDASDRSDVWFSSPLRTDAMALDTLLAVRPDDARVAKLARGLREQRRGGRWRNTQENAYALLALAGYAARAEADRPAQRVQAWIGERRVLAADVKGFDETRRGGSVALEQLGNGDTHVVVERKGRGRAYYRVGIEWTPRDAPARAQGLTLERRLIADEVVSGERYLVAVELGSDTPQRFVAVEIPLPAGLEPIDAGLGRGARARVTPDARTSALLSHEELRPDRVVLFFDELPAGTTRHAIPVVATTRGRFTLPAAVAEAMYEPEVRARTTSATVVVR